MDWQRHYAYFAELVGEGTPPAAIVPGDDPTRRGRRPVAGHPTAGLGPAERGAAASARHARREEDLTGPQGPGDDDCGVSGLRAGGEAFEKGLHALQQYTAREGVLPGRAGVQEMPDGEIRCVGVRLAHQKQRRDRLDPDQPPALVELGVYWAQWKAGVPRAGATGA
ncbi:hypothetical protein AB0D29_36015 [Streptomyces sp. NPDC048424]|uniref:hypothetical protein n=1 Tax=Streptomyces sp. NPDC048424 TaxID=3155265 RepID=UPI00341E287B